MLKTLTRMEEVLRETPWNLPSRIYAQPFEIQVGGPLNRAEFIARLARLGYRPAEPVRSSGEYSWDEKGFDLFLFDAVTPDGSRKAQRLRVDLSDDVVSLIWNMETGVRRSSLELEPELLGSIYDPSAEDRRPIPLGDVPQLFKDCLLVSEDQSFFEHHGVDPSGIVRAFLVNLKSGSVKQGASTITQQLMRNLFLTRKKTYRRKIDEAIMAVLMELTRSKDRILELYINECYFGQAGAVSVAGLRQGARYYFNQEPRFLRPAQCAMLVAILRGPNYYNPFKYPDRVKKRRDFLLARMAQEGTLSEEERDLAIQEPLPEAPHSLSGLAPYVVDAVRRQLSTQLNLEELQSEGYSIFTTIDMGKQLAAKRAIQKTLDELESRYPRLKRAEQPLQAALVSLDPYTGMVLAMEGGRDFKKSPYNRALLAFRPIGSVIKPFLYLYALEGSQRGDYEWLPNSLLEDTPITIDTPSGPWKPENYHQDYYGLVTLRRALEESLNVPAVRLSQRIGLNVLADYFTRLGIPNPPRVPSLVLGTVEMTPYQVAGLYTLFLNQGERLSPYFIRSIVKEENRRLPLPSPQPPERAASPQAVYQVLSMLEGVFERGTAKSARSLGWKGIAAGKTGTTDRRLDSWFVGMTPDAITVAWVGFDQPEPTGLTGSMGALPIWVNYMKEAYPEGNPEPFPIPKGLTQKSVLYFSGQLAAPGAPAVIPEYFLSQTIGEESPTVDMPVPPRGQKTGGYEIKHSGDDELLTKPVKAVEIDSKPLKEDKEGEWRIP